MAEGWLPLLSMEEVKAAVAGACVTANVAQLGATVVKVSTQHRKMESVGVGWRWLAFQSEGGSSDLARAAFCCQLCACCRLFGGRNPAHFTADQRPFYRHSTDSPALAQGEARGHDTCPPTYYVTNKYTHGFQVRCPITAVRCRCSNQQLHEQCCACGACRGSGKAGDERIDTCGQTETETNANQRKPTPTNANQRKPMPVVVCAGHRGGLRRGAVRILIAALTPRAARFFRARLKKQCLSCSQTPPFLAVLLPAEGTGSTTRRRTRS